VSEPTERLVRELVRDLRPVRRVPALRVAAAGVLAVAGGVALWLLATRGARPTLGADLSHDLAFASVFAGLALAGAAGTVAALASAVPGRESAARIATALAAAGLGAAALVAGAEVGLRGLAAGSPPANDWICFRQAWSLSALPSLLLVALVLRGWVQAPLRTAATALAGGLALGAFLGLASCVSWGPRHLLLGHVGPPVVAVLVAALPLGALVRRFAR
jgi:hypothetical protein